MVLARLFAGAKAQNLNLIDIDQSAIQPIIDNIDGLSEPATRKGIKDICQAIIRDHVTALQRSVEEVNSCKRLAAVVVLLRDLGSDKDVSDIALNFKVRMMDNRLMSVMHRMYGG